MAAVLMLRAPSDPPDTAMTVAPGGRSSSRRAAWRPDGDRSTANISGRTGFPVTTARGSAVPGNDTAAALAKGPASRLARPGTAFCSAMTNGTRSTIAPTTHGTLA